MFIKPTYTVHGSKPQLNELQVQTSKRKKLFGNFKNEIGTFQQLLWATFLDFIGTLWLVEMR